MSPPLATVTTQFLERPGLAPSTIKSYEGALMPLLNDYGRLPIELLDRSTLEEYLNQLGHLAFTTHHRHQATLQALFNYAAQQGYIRANPIARLSRRKPDPNKGEHTSDQPIRYLTPDQLQLLDQAIQADFRMNAIVRLLHRTGARISELLALNLIDMQLDPHRFQVVGKGNKQRWCFYSDDAAQALNDYLRYARHHHHNALFTAQQPITQKVSRLHYRTVHADWKCLIAPIPDLDGCRLHDLRHTFATERVGLMSLEELRALMGHESIQTTLRYQKVTSAQAENAAQNALQRLLNDENRDTK